MALALPGDLFSWHPSRPPPGSSIERSSREGALFEEAEKTPSSGRKYRGAEDHGSQRYKGQKQLVPPAISCAERNK